MNEPTRSRLGERRDQMKETASSAASTARHAAQDRAEGLLHNLLAKADHVADALDAAACSLRTSVPWLGDATESLSHQVAAVHRGRGDGCRCPRHGRKGTVEPEDGQPHAESHHVLRAR